MDASEWEAMKKNEKLLEEALEREREQSKNIEQLQKEKIEAMELNSKKVTIVEEVHTVENLLSNELKLVNSNLSHAEKDIEELTKELKLATEKNQAFAGFNKLKQDTLKVLTATKGRFGNKKAIDELKKVWQD